MVPLAGINIWAFQAIKALASPALSAVLAPLADSFYVVLPLITIYLYLRKDRNTPLFVGTFIVLFAISEAIKHMVAEPRPCTQPSLSWINVVGSCESSYGFPSSHATTLTGLVFFMSKYRILQALYVIWLILVLFGRVYLGQHYFTDVVAGMVTSLVAAYLIWWRREALNRMLRPILVVLRLER